MGQSRIIITLTGDHGCGRKAKEGEPIDRCDQLRCVDCQATEFVKQLKTRGGFFGPDDGATITHWPGSEGEVTDDLLSGKRIAGQFGDASVVNPVEAS